jgi:hypothetical protein
MITEAAAEYTEQSETPMHPALSYISTWFFIGPSLVFCGLQGRFDGFDDDRVHLSPFVEGHFAQTFVESWIQSERYVHDLGFCWLRFGYGGFLGHQFPLPWKHSTRTRTFMDLTSYRPMDLYSLRPLGVSRWPYVYGYRLTPCRLSLPRNLSLMENK